ncbi:MAG: helix-turn-helix transcriptional regulator [Selenomonadaceae bacterium]|nr:helix-turn-helix transcriptional regulator [Selenomonadaceae bacterium]
MELPDSLRRFRKDFHLTQREVASSIGMAESAYQRYEQGKREPAFRQLLTLADTFNVSLDYLVGRTDKPDAEEETPDTAETDLLGVFRELNADDRKNLSAFAKFLLSMKEKPD